MILHGDCLEHLSQVPDGYFQTCVTSPPYWGLRDYGTDGQLGLEKTPDEYVANLVRVFGEVRRVLKDDGTLWLNLGDSYVANVKGKGSISHITNTYKDQDVDASVAFKKTKRATGLKTKDLVGIPWRVAFALQADGWYLRQDIIWHKPNPMPESVRDRCTKAHEYIFLISKSPKYYFDVDAIKEPSVQFAKVGPRKRTRVNGVSTEDTRKLGLGNACGVTDTRNKRSVWTVTTKPFKGAHFATFPCDLIEPCILAGSAFGDYVLDPFAGSGTTGLVARKHGRKFIGIELNESYVALADKRISGGK